ncbi:unnamed protein product [Paramecium primaurelia]|uniref:Uncharacterized protein n=1 Tax=Paramecium primaurelia TaxID=5886 RepID=A0A8S1PB94_PARPR|nr:unnamed protein product [Paramecium primaurelia]
MFNLKYQCQIKNNRCIKQKTQLDISKLEGFIQFQYKTQKERLEARKAVQKRRSKVIKNRFQDEDSEQYIGVSLSISNSYSGELFDNFDNDSSFSDDYPTFEDEESSLEIELVSNNPIPEQPPNFTIERIFSEKQVINLFCILLYFIYI